MTPDSLVAAVTDAAQGIDERIAEVLAGAGYQLALFDRQPIVSETALTLDLRH